LRENRQESEVRKKKKKRKKGNEKGNRKELKGISLKIRFRLLNV